MGFVFIVNMRLWLAIVRASVHCLGHDVFFFCVSRPARALISAVGKNKQTNKRFRLDKFAAAAPRASSHQIIDIPALAHTTSTVTVDS